MACSWYRADAWTLLISVFTSGFGLIMVVFAGPPAQLTLRSYLAPPDTLVALDTSPICVPLPPCGALGLLQETSGGTQSGSSFEASAPAVRMAMPLPGVDASRYICDGIPVDIG